MRRHVMGALLLAGLVVGRGAAQETGQVSGVVRNEAGELLKGVRVELVERGVSALTDARGRYLMGGLAAGRYTLRYSLLGRALHERSVAVAAGVVATDTVELGDAAIPLAPLVVLSERTRLVGDAVQAAEASGSAQVLEREAVRDEAQIYDDVHRLLRQVPGVNVQEEDGYGLRPNIGLRGTGTQRSEKITLMEDGVLIAPAPYAAPAAYYFPVAGRMEAIEVRKGSSQIKYGPRTIGGALNLVSASIPPEVTLDADVAVGTNGTHKLRAAAGGSGEHVGWLLQTYRLQTDGFKRLDTGGGTGFDIEDYVAKVRVNSAPEANGVYQQLELKLGYYDEVSEETYLGLTEADFRSDPLRRYAGSQADVMRADHKQIQLRYFASLLPGLDVTATAYRNDFGRNWYKLGSVGGASIASVLADPTAHAAELAVLRGGASAAGALSVRANNREYYSQGLQSTLGLRTGTGGAAHDVELGVRYHEDQEDRFQHDDAYTMSGGRMLLASRGAPGSQANRVSAASAWAFYVQDHVQLGRWSITPGVRYETIGFTRRDYAAGDAARAEPVAVRDNGVSAWIPGVSASFAANAGLRLFAGVHRGFGPPGPGADEETEAESSVNYELGARLRRASLAAQVIGFYSDYTNILGASTLSSGGDGSGDLHNGGAVAVRGVEATLRYDPLQGRTAETAVPLDVAYTYTHARFRSSFESDYEPWGTVSAGHELPYLPEHGVHLSAGIEHGRAALRVTASSSSAMRTRAGAGEPPASERTDAFFVLDASTTYTLREEVVLYAGVQNLLDERYVVARQPAGARPGLPRSLQFGVRYAR
ncbi:MAG: TonB-dependent receptor domain-containing protein [Longimicrobiales bacterium]